GSDKHAPEHGQADEALEHRADDVGLDDVDDAVLGLDAEAGELLGPAGAEAAREDFADGVQFEAAVGHGEEEADDGEREEGVDGVPPHVPDAVADDVARDPLGPRAADAGAPAAHGDHAQPHAAAGAGPVLRAAGAAGEPDAHRADDRDVHDDHDEADVHGMGYSNE